MTDPVQPAATPAPSTPAAAAVATALATRYDGFTVLVIDDLTTAIPDVATALNNLKLKQGDVLICFVGRAGG